MLQVDGTVVIFDIETNGVARKLQGHTRQIQSLRYVIEFFLVKSGTNTF